MHEPITACTRVLPANNHALSPATQRRDSLMNHRQVAYPRGTAQRRRSKKPRPATNEADTRHEPLGLLLAQARAEKISL